MTTIHGRSQLLARLHPRVERACTGGVGGVILLTGEAGIGKSQLAEELAATARALGASVALGRCWEAGGAPAYWPFIQVFRDLRMDEDPFSQSGDLDAAMSEARFALFDRVVSALLVRAREQPLCLLLDDLHAADEPSLLLALLLAQRSARAPLLVIGAYRDALLSQKPRSAALLAQLAREAEVTPLARLPEACVADWLAQERPELDASLAQPLFALTEGHPLLVREALRLGWPAVPWSRGRDNVLEERLGSLTPATRALLRAGAVLGRELAAADLLTISERSAPEVDAALGEGLAREILVTEPLRFSHVLLRDRLYAELDASERAALHVRVGRALLARHADPVAAVHHFFEGQLALPGAEIAALAAHAAEQALSRLAFEQALDIGRRALALPGLPVALGCQLQLHVAQAHMHLGQTLEAKALCSDVAQRAAAAGERELLAHAALVYGTELLSGLVEPQMVQLLQQAHDALDPRDSALRARVMVRLAAALTPPQDTTHDARIVQLTRDAIQMARRVGDRHALLYVLQFAATVASLISEQERFGPLEESLGLARALKLPLVQARILPAYLTTLIGLGELDRVEALLPEYEALVRELGQPWPRIRQALVKALVASLRGDLAAADRCTQQALGLARDSDFAGAQMLVLVHLLSQAHLRGDPQLLAAHSTDLLGRVRASRSSGSHVAWYLACVGRSQEARAYLQEFEAPEALAQAELWELMGLAETCVVLRDHDFGARVYARAVQAIDRMFWSMAPGVLIGPSARVLGDLARLLGQRTAAERHYAEALAACEKMGASLLVARCQAARDAPYADGSPEPLAPPLAAAAVQLQREGELWRLTRAGRQSVHLRDSKGLQYLQVLLEQPGRALHVAALAGVEQRTGDAGPVLDPQARAAYRARAEALREELSEAEQFQDIARVERARAELEALGEQLAQAVGLGGRERRAASDVERLRINVQRRIKDAIDRIGSADPDLGRYLSATVKTGTTCVYQPL